MSDEFNIIAFYEKKDKLLRAVDAAMEVEAYAGVYSDNEWIHKFYRMRAKDISRDDIKKVNAIWKKVHTYDIPR